MEWFDNLGYEITVGDEVVPLTGNLAYSVQKIKKLGTREELFVVATVTFENGTTVYAHNVIDLRELGMSSDKIDYSKQGCTGFDFFGNPISIGDQILYLHRMEMYSTVGIAKKFANKNCIMDIPQNRFDQTSYKKPYKEIFSLSSLGLSESIIRKENRN